MVDFPGECYFQPGIYTQRALLSFPFCICKGGYIAGRIPDANV